MGALIAGVGRSHCNITGREGDDAGGVGGKEIGLVNTTRIAFSAIAGDIFTVRRISTT